VSPKVFLSLRLPNSLIPQARSLASFSTITLTDILCSEADRFGVLIRRKNVTVLWAALSGPDGVPPHVYDDSGQVRQSCRVWDPAAAATAATDLQALGNEVERDGAIVALRIAIQLADVPLSESCNEQEYMKRTLRVINAAIAEKDSAIQIALRPRGQLLMHSCQLAAEPLPDDDRKVAERRYNEKIAGLREERRGAHQELATALDSLHRLQREIIASVRDGQDWSDLGPEYKEQEAAVIRLARREALAHHSVSASEQRVTTESLHVERAGGSAPSAKCALDLVKVQSPGDVVRRRWQNGVLPSAQARRLKTVEKEVYVPACRHLTDIEARMPAQLSPLCTPEPAALEASFGAFVEEVRVPKKIK